MECWDRIGRLILVSMSLNTWLNPVKATAFAKGILSIENRQHFDTTDWLRGTWRLVVDGKTKASGTLPRLDIAPNSSEPIPIECPVLSLKEGEEAFLHVSFVAESDTAWCAAGHLVAWDQLFIARKPFCVSPVYRGGKPLHIEQSEQGCRIKNDMLELNIVNGTSLIDKISWQGKPVVLAGPRLQIWRAATDNDGVKQWTGQDKKPLGRWRAAGFDNISLRSSVPEIQQLSEGRVLVQLQHMASCAASESAVCHRHVYTIHPSGVIEVVNTFDVNPDLPELPRLGVALTLPGEFEQLAWYGRGPWENYRDRNRGAMIDKYSSTVTDQYVPYVVPQEHGNRSDARWVALNNRSTQLQVFAENAMEFSASHYTPEDLFQATHSCDLIPHDETFLNLDYLNAGLGTGSCGPAALPQYQVLPGHYRFAYTLKFSSLEF